MKDMGRATFLATLADDPHVHLGGRGAFQGMAQPFREDGPRRGIDPLDMTAEERPPRFAPLGFWFCQDFATFLWHRERCRLRESGEAEVSESVLLAVMLDQLQGEIGLLRERDRLGKSEVGVTGFTGGATDRPTGALFAGTVVEVERASHRPTLLRMIRYGIAQGDRPELIPQGELELIEDEVSMLRPTRPLASETGIGQHFETERGVGAGGELPGNGVGRRGWILSPDEDRAIRLDRKLHPLRGGESSDGRMKQTRSLGGLLDRSAFEKHFLPRPEATRELVPCRIQPGLDRLASLGVGGESALILRPGFGRFRHLGIHLVAVVEVGEEFVILAVGDLVVFVGVAACAGEGESHPD